MNASLTPLQRYTGDFEISREQRIETALCGFQFIMRTRRAFQIWPVHGVALASTNENTAPSLAKRISRPLSVGELVDGCRTLAPEFAPICIS